MTDAQLKVVPDMLEESGTGFITLALDPDDYYDVLRGTLRYGSRTGMQTILFSASLPEATLKCTMDKLEEPMAHVQLIDCMSDMVMSEKSGQSRYVESPRLLEMVVLEIERCLRKNDKPCLLIIDSVNSLLIHNPKERAMAFLEVLYNRIKLRDHTLVLLHMANEEGIDVPNLRLLSDRLLVLER